MSTLVEGLQMSDDKSQPDLDTRDTSKIRVEAQFSITVFSFDQSHISDADNDFHARFLNILFTSGTKTTLSAY